MGPKGSPLTCCVYYWIRDFWWLKSHYIWGSTLQIEAAIALGPMVEPLREPKAAHTLIRIKYWSYKAYIITRTVIAYFSMIFKVFGAQAEPKSNNGEGNVIWNLDRIPPSRFHINSTIEVATQTYCSNSRWYSINTNNPVFEFWSPKKSN